MELLIKLMAIRYILGFILGAIGILTFIIGMFYLIYEQYRFDNPREKK